MPDALAFDLPPSSTLAGRYRVRRRIGQGSIAQVVEARDEALGIDVALKVLYPNLRQNEAVADRFRREVQVVRRIAHPHVIRIHDLVDDDGLLFLVMDLHAGGDLADRVARAGPLSVDALRELARQVCGALEAAHRAGVVHRDVKPQNILVGPAGALDVRLCDFGLARTADLAGLTTRSTVLGTPEYMAPEVIAEGHADPRSDLYSVAVVLFEAATGRLPFRADSPYQLLRQHLTGKPPRARDFVPDLPEEIDEALSRALSKEPLDRFASAADLAAALDGPRALAVTSAPAPRTVCRRCGGAVVALVHTCVDCGATSLRVRQESGGRAVLVTGPGEPAEKIDGRSHVALVALLRELPPGTAEFEKLSQKPPRLPFYVADRLDERSAAELLGRLQEIGFEARLERRASLRPVEMRSKVRRMAGRYLGIAFGSGWMFWQQAWMWSSFPFFKAMALAAFVAAPLVVPALVFRRPVLRLKGLPGAGHPSEERLAACLGRLPRREDRRLIARLLDRLHLAGRLGGAEIASALGGRAALAAEGLVAVEASAAALDEEDLQRTLAAGRGDAEVAGALDRLRDGERLRGVLVSDLLRTFSRLDLLCLKLARVGALQARDRAAALASEVEELTLALAAEDDLAALLGTKT